MLVALMTLLFLGGGGSTNAVLAYIADTKPAVKEAVTDEARQEDALATLKAMKSEQKDFSKLVGATVKELKAELSEDPGTIDDAFWSTYFNAKKASDERMIELRFKLKDQLTREEWQAVFASGSRE